ncbi:MAG: hypothetical protein K0R65_2523 [Crocinitomicaceae bacterium]|jgi:hypothetical protein|nr:hypothetical protein [Crocinitomicaceae bacterium]
MEAYVNLALSSCAFLLSGSALLFNITFNRRERRRNIRQTLSNALNNVAKINIEIANLKQENAGVSPHEIDVRRNLDFQRSTLMTEAEFLIYEKPELLTAIDCSLVAFTFNELKDFKKTGHYWQEAIARSKTDELRHIHTRDYAFFLFGQNREEDGREAFNRALAIELKKNDQHLAVMIDTYLLWASAEFLAGCEKEFKQRISSAKKICEQLRNKSKCQEIEEKIKASQAQYAEPGN